MGVYLDTSALTKLVVAEAESSALRAWAASHEEFVASDLARTELARAVRRVAPALMPAARAVLDSLTLIAARPDLFDAAGRLDPPTLRSLDALHLATALDLGDDLDAFVTYDDRLADAAARYGLTVVAPA